MVGKSQDYRGGKFHPLYGTKLSKETKEKISKSLKDPENRKSYNYGKEWIEKLSNNMMGKPKSLEHAENISRGKKGIATVHHDEEIRKKIGDSQRGEKHHFSKKIIFINPENERFEIKSNFQKFVKDNNLTLAVIRKYINKGKIPPPAGNRYGIPRINTTGWEVIVPDQE